ncbi:MAG TPA: hypothetical protein H9828_03560 [Candidatus Alistipes intestinigallinarum]|uniref:Uncharacterized protein n=1 Tax=Candidatus Alistipes intestinigallinarum TaxID=2838440 RepID=A0A9D1Z0I1_9BACT|nr:hypothetical protein [Candidatus Alistipes intestinigallinarum]
MKKLCSLILCAACSTACVDMEYDLSNINTDNIAIGDESSRFEVPLLKVLVSMDELNGTDGDAIDEIFNEADTWLPSQLPNQDENGMYVLVQQLVGNEDYVDHVLSGLLDQMASDSEKLDQVASLLQEKYYDEFSSLLPGVSVEEFKNEFIELYSDNELLRQRLDEKIEELARGYLTGLEVSLPALTYSVDRIDLSDDVVDMLVENLDGKEVSEPKNTLHMAGTIDNRLPVSITASPVFTPTEVAFTAEIEANNDANVLPETRLFADDLQSIVRGLTIEIAVNINKYYPGKGFDRGTIGDEKVQPQLTINLHLIKRGALKFDI